MIINKNLLIMKKILLLAVVLTMAVSGYAQNRVSADDTFMKAVELYDNDAYGEALQYFNIWLKTHPDDAYAWTYISAIECESKNYDEALEASDKALEGVFANNKDKEFKGWMHYIRSNILVHKSDTVGALNELTEAIKLDKNDADYYHRRASLYSRTHQHDKAIADFNAEEKLGDNGIDPIIGRGCVYSDMGDSKRAIEEFSKAIKQESDNAEAYAKRAIEYFNIKDYDRSIADVIAALKLDFDNVNALWALEYLKADAMRQLSPKVRAVYKETGDSRWLDLIK